MSWMGKPCPFTIPVVCFIHVFDQTLAEQLYSDKRLLFEPHFAAFSVLWSVDSNIALAEQEELGIAAPRVQ